MKKHVTRKIVFFRMLFLVEVFVGVYYVFYGHNWDGGMYHAAMATILKDLAEV